MRIITGLLVLYVHLAYCFDLREFFGPNAWWDQKTAVRDRVERPTFSSPWNWPELSAYRPMIATPQIPDRRAAVFDFLKHLPEDKRQRDAALQYLYFLLEKGSNNTPVANNQFYQGLMLVRKSAEMLDEQHQRMRAELGREGELNPRSMPITPPDFFLQMSPNDRVRLWDDAQQFLNTLPKESTLNFTYILEWMLEMNPLERFDLLNYLRDLPSGPEARRIVEYFELWHQDPRQAYDHGAYTFSLWFHVGDKTTMWACHAVILFVILLFTLGVFTRVTSVLTWLAALFYIHRVQYVLFGMDTMMNVLLLYLMIGPSGAALSVDRLMARWRASRALFRAGGKSVPWAEAVLAGPRPSAMANFAIRLLQIHFCFIYMASGLAKLKGTMWWDTTAAWYTIANPEFCPMDKSIYRWLLFKLASVRPLILLTFAGVTYFTLILEICLPFMVWTRLRPIVVTLAILLHSGIAWIMGLTCFGLLMMTLLLCYIPSSVIRDRLTWARGSGPQLQLRCNSRSPRQARLVAFLRTFDLAGQITIHDEASTNPSTDAPLQLVGEDGKARAGFSLYQYAWKNIAFLNLLGWLLWVPGVSILIRSLLGVPSETSPIGKGPPAMPGLSKPTAS
jgi:hypothetical protein